ALRYGGTGRQLVLALKHGDRPEIARPAAAWIHRAAAPFFAAEPLILPVPIHWRRLLRRRYNQSALLAEALAQRTRLTHVPDLLIRARATPSQDGRDREARFANLSGAISVDPRRAAQCRGRAVLIVDDVMTSGATLAAASEACLAAGAERVFVATLARVAKDA
ncbi:ComF family protein, partial [Thioclava sp. BHET1]